MCEPMGTWKRTHFSREVTPDMDNDTVIICGWARAIRGSAKLKFIQLADREGNIQITAKSDSVKPAVLKKISSLNREDVIAVKGTVKKNNVAPGKIEIIPQGIKILNKSETPLPMEVVQKKTPAELPTRLDSRFMDLRRPEIAAIFSIRNHVISASRNFLDEQGFIEINSPKITGIPAESGANVFPIKYFEKEAYLAQSPQFYKQIMMASAFDRVFELGPVFRAEKHHTSRHICEYTSLDFEFSFIKDYTDVIKMTEDMFIHIYKYIQKNAKTDLEILNKKITIPKKPFPVVTMREAYKMLKRAGFEAEEGDDLNSENERNLGEIIRKNKKHNFVFLTEFPWKVRPFYTYRNESKPEWTESFDLICNGLEITTGGQREHRFDTLLKQVKEKKIDPKNLGFYLKVFKHGVPPHGGTGTGIDRIVMTMLDLKNIREATLFPREPDRLEP